MRRPVHVIFGSTLGLAAGCSCADRGISIDGLEPTTSIGDASSEGDTTAATSGLSAGESTFGAMESHGDDTTTEPLPSVHARVLAFGTHVGTTGLWYVEYDGGSLPEPLSIVTVPDEATLLHGLVTSPSRGFAAYRAAAASQEPMLVDLREGAPPSPTPIAAAPASNPSPWFHFVPSEDAILFETDGGTPESRVWLTALEDGVPQAPQLVAGPAPGGAIVRPLREVAGDDTWMLVEIEPAEDESSTDLWLAPLFPPDPSALVPVSTVQGQGHVAEYVRVLPGDNGVIYRSRDASFVRDLWLVPIQDGSPGSATRIDAPLPAPKDTWEVYAVHVLEPGNGLVYWTAEQIGDTYGELWFLPLDRAGVGAPRLLGPPAEADVKPTQVFSSPDGRWVGYSADDPTAGDRTLWLVDVAGPSLSEPVRVADPGMAMIVTHARFDLASAYLYYELGAGASPEGLYRTDVSAAVPGFPQLVAENAGFASSLVAFSPEDQRVAYVTGPEGVIEVVDIASSEPATSAELDVACSDAWFTAGSDALVFTGGASSGPGKPLFVADLLTDTPPALLLDSASFVRVLPD